jgi:hypothetical protein
MLSSRKRKPKLPKTSIGYSLTQTKSLLKFSVFPRNKRKLSRAPLMSSEVQEFLNSMTQMRWLRLLSGSVGSESGLRSNIGCQRMASRVLCGRRSAMTRVLSSMSLRAIRAKGSVDILMSSGQRQIKANGTQILKPSCFR